MQKWSRWWNRHRYQFSEIKLHVGWDFACEWKGRQYNLLQNSQLCWPWMFWEEMHTVLSTAIELCRTVPLHRWLRPNQLKVCLSFMLLFYNAVLSFWLPSRSGLPWCLQSGHYGLCVCQRSFTLNKVNVMSVVYLKFSRVFLKGNIWVFISIYYFINS